MAKKSTVEKTDKEIIQAAKDCLANYLERESDNIRRAKDDILFAAGEQWPEGIKKDRESPAQDGGPRPCPVADKTQQFVRQVINEERLNRASIRVRPVDDKADVKTAKIITGLIRNIEDQSEATVCYTTGGEHAVESGFGYWRVIPEYCDPMSFEQDIRIKRIPNRFSVALGPHQEPDGADAKEGMIWEDISRSEFKRRYPGKKEASVEADGWANKETVRVAEYFCIKPEKVKLYLLDGGEVVKESEITEEQRSLIVDERHTEINRLKWYVLSAAEVLEETDLPGQYIPIIKVVGVEKFMPDGKCRLSGMIEPMKDSQRMHNYALAGFIEQVALAPRAPWVAEEDQIVGYEDIYSEANKRNIAVLPYRGKAVDGHLLPSPQRTPPPGMSTGWQAILQNTEHSISASIGNYGPTVGAKSQEKSGIALQEQKTQGAVGNFHFPDNLARSIQHTGRILLEWIPTYYDSRRIVRILGEDDSEELVWIDPEQEQPIIEQYGEGGSVIKTYNLNLGKYDISVSTGPSYSSKRQEAAEMQMQLAQAIPDLFPLIGDVLLKNMDWPETDRISERLKTLLPAEIRKAEEQNLDNPEVAAMTMQVEQAMAQIEQRAAELQAAEQQINQYAESAKSDKAQADAARKELAAEKRVFDAEVKAVKAEIELMQASLNNEQNEKLQIEREKIQADREKHDIDVLLKLRELGIHPEQIEEKEDQEERNNMMMQMIATIMESTQELKAKSQKPRSFKIEKNKIGDLIAINGKPIRRDENGSLEWEENEEVE